MSVHDKKSASLVFYKFDCNIIKALEFTTVAVQYD